MAEFQLHGVEKWSKIQAIVDASCRKHKLTFARPTNSSIYLVQA